MLYSFKTDNARLIQSADYCFFDKPILHPSRELPFHDFIYMVDGEWSVRCANEEFTIKNGDVLILPANMPHYGVKNCAPKTRTMYLHIYLVEGDGICENGVADNGIVLPNHINTVNNPNIKALFQKIIQTKTNKDICSAYVHTLIYEMSLINLNEAKFSLAQSIYSYILSSEKMLSNSEVAEHFCVSVRGAELAFKSEYGMTLHSFVIESKLKKAQQYLHDYPNMKMNSIAVALGFYDEFHFSRLFKTKFGISPSEYKKQIKFL